MPLLRTSALRRPSHSAKLVLAIDIPLLVQPEESGSSSTRQVLIRKHRENDLV